MLPLTTVLESVHTMGVGEITHPSADSVIVVGVLAAYNLYWVPLVTVVPAVAVVRVEAAVVEVNGAGPELRILLVLKLNVPTPPTLVLAIVNFGPNVKVSGPIATY